MLQYAAKMLSMGDGTCDAVFGKRVLLRPNLDVTIPEIARVLRPGGRAVFLEPLIHNRIIEGNRRLTPHLCGPTERALSIRDIVWMGNHIVGCHHREIILLSILPVLGATLVGKRDVLNAWR